MKPFFRRIDVSAIGTVPFGFKDPQLTRRDRRCFYCCNTMADPITSLRPSLSCLPLYRSNFSWGETILPYFIDSMRTQVDLCGGFIHVLV